MLLLLWGLPVVSYAQAPDLSLPSLPPLPGATSGQGSAQASSELPVFGAPAVTAVSTPAANMAASRASESSIDALLPPVAEPAQPASTLGIMGAAADTSGLPPLPSNAGSTPLMPQAAQTSLPATNMAQADATQTTAAKPPPRQPMKLEPPRQPPTLEEEAAAAGITLPPPSMPVIPSATAQALLSGAPIREEGAEETKEDDGALPLKVKEKPTYRDLPKLKPSITPLSLSYNYQRQVLPPAVYRKEYSPNNRHLPKAQMREDYDRHFFGVVAANDVNATRAFLDMGKSADLQNTRGETLLMTAVRYGALDTARLLLARGANPSLGGANGQTPLSLAQQSGQRDMVLVLQARGA